MASDKILDLAGDRFAAEVLAAAGPVLVVFQAAWGGPCRRLEPVLEGLAEEESRVRFLRLNVDECPDLASRYDVRTLPTLILFRGGEEVDRMVGAMPRPFLERFLARCL